MLVDRGSLEQANQRGTVNKTSKLTANLMKKNTVTYDQANYE